MIRKHDIYRINTKVEEFQNHIGRDQSLRIVSLILMETSRVRMFKDNKQRQKNIAPISTIEKFHINPQVHDILLWVAVHKKWMDVFHASRWLWNIRILLICIGIFSINIGKHTINIVILSVSFGLLSWLNNSMLDDYFDHIYHICIWNKS